MRPVGLRFALALALVVAAGSPLRAQSLTAQIAGNVLDLTDSAVPGATVTLTNAGTNWILELKTGGDGAFLFVDLVAGTYDLKVTREGFNTVVRKDIPVASTERYRVQAIVLAPAAVQDTVVVTNEAPFVQTTTSARSGQITRDNIEDIALKARDVMALLVLLPGVVDTNPREAPSWTSSSGLSINGRSAGFNFSYDGITNKGTDGGALLAAPALDSIAEVRVQSSNFQAEYRPQFRRFNHDDHAQRFQRLPRQRGLLQARRLAQRQRVHQEGPVPERPDRSVQTGALRVRQLCLDAGRSRARAGKHLQPRPE